MSLTSCTVSFKDLVVATTAGLVESNVILLDLNGFEEGSRLASKLTLAVLAHSDRVVHASHTQTTNATSLLEAVREACLVIHKEMEEGLKTHIVNCINPSHFV